MGLFFIILILGHPSLIIHVEAVFLFQPSCWDAALQDLEKINLFLMQGSPAPGVWGGLGSFEEKTA